MAGIGRPHLTSYGSSYGTYGGARLSDQVNPIPDPTKVNNTDAKDVVEWRPFASTIKDFIKGRLGWPVVEVELTDYQIETCIEEAISKLEYHAPNWMTQYAVFDVSGGVGVYELPEEVANNLNDVWFRRNVFRLGATPGSLEYDFAIMFFTNSGLFNNWNVSEYLLMQQYMKQISRVLGQFSTWQIVNGKYLHIWPIPDYEDTAIVEFRALDPNTIHPAYKSWLQRYSLCIAKEILGRIRSKYQVLPGPSGGAKLDGELLLRESIEEKEKLLEELRSEIEGPPLFDIS